MGISVAHYDMVFLKPIDEELLTKVAKKFSHIITVEDGVIKGGLGSAVLEFLSENGFSHVQVHRIGIGDEFITHGSIQELQHIAGIDQEYILKQIVQLYHTLKGDTPDIRSTSAPTNPITHLHNR
jgi:1-deoxy-D-xylulose-5-phosphate synthase